MTRSTAMAVMVLLLIGACTNGAGMPACKDNFERVVEGVLSLGMTEFDGCVPRATGSFKLICFFANRGDAAAQSSVGDRYRRIGVVSNRYPPPSDIASAYKRAYMWYSLAAANGDSYGAERRRSLAGEMTPEQITEAELLAAMWQPDPNEC